MLKLLLKLLVYAAVGTFMFMAYADIPFVHKHPWASLITFFVVLFILGKVVPAILIFTFKLLALFILVFGTSYYLGTKYNIKLPVLPDFTKSSVSKTSFKSTDGIFSGIAEKLSDDMSFKLGDKLVKLYGLKEPEKGEKCVDKNGTVVNCQAYAQQELSSKIEGKDVTCKPIKSVGGVYFATCLADGEDLSSMLIKSGWFTSDSEIGQYEAEEKEARKGRRGLWQKKEKSFLENMKLKMESLF